MGLLDRAVAAAVPAFPRPAVQLVARRYIAGTTLADAMTCLAELQREGACGTVDILGENVQEAAELAATRDAYLQVLREIHERALDANISVKLTALGLQSDPSACESHVRALCEQARAHGSFVRLDMEDSTCTDATLDLYLRLRRDFDNVGPVLQACLRRSIDDVRRLTGPGQPALNVRLCKGIYRERRAIAWKDREIVRRNFAWLLQELLERGARVGIATHDEVLVWDALRRIDRLQVPRERYELQMLLGVDADLRQILLAGGHRLRVYVPFGERWYEYSVRRLRENPEVAGHVARATATRLLGGRA
jgi:proline dehydrogenase